MPIMIKGKIVMVSDINPGFGGEIWQYKVELEDGRIAISPKGHYLEKIGLLQIGDWGMGGPKFDRNAGIGDLVVCKVGLYEGDEVPEFKGKLLLLGMYGDNWNKPGGYKKPPSKNPGIDGTLKIGSC